MAFSKHQQTDSSTSVFVISRAITTGKSEISKQETNDMRIEYLTIVENKSSPFIQKKQSMYDRIVEPVYASLNLKPKLTSFTIHVLDRKSNKLSKHTMNNQIICFGRLSGNDIVLSKDPKISRIQGYMFVAGNKIVYLDVWSISGTNTKQRSNIHKLPLSTVPHRRNVLLYGKNEIIHLNVAKCVDVLIIPQFADKKKLKTFQVYKDIKYIERGLILDDDIKTYDHKKKKINKTPTKIIPKTVYIDNNYAQNKINKQSKPHAKRKSGKIKHKHKHKKLSTKKQQFKDWIYNELELDEYYELFVREGFDDIDVVGLLTDKDLKELGINKKGSRMKLILYANKQQKYHKETIGNNEGHNDVEAGDTEAHILSYFVNDNYTVSKMNKNEMVTWVKTIGLSEQWENIVVTAILNCNYNENDINGLQSGKDVGKLFGIGNPMLASRIWKEMKQIK